MHVHTSFLFAAVAVLASGCIIEPGDIDQRPDGSPPPNCLAMPVCDDGWVEVEACPADDVDCRELSLCGTTIYCQPAAQCLAYPSCAPDQEASDQPCGDDEDGCHANTICGSTVYCRDVDQCEAYPACDEGDLEREEPCVEFHDDVADGCYERTVCGATIFCEPGVQCAAVPTCEPWEIESDEACVEDEWGCREAHECGAVVYCREDPCGGERIPTPDAGGDDDNGDSDGEEAGDRAEDPPQGGSGAVACP